MVCHVRQSPALFSFDMRLWPGIYPSVGGCDEFIRLFLFRAEVSDEKLRELQGKCTGLIDHGEIITLQVVLLEDLYRITSDVKALASILLYEKLTAEGKIAPFNGGTQMQV